MAYNKTSRYPAERASKLGHMRLVQDQHTQRSLAAFTASPPPRNAGTGEIKTGHLDLSAESGMLQVIAIDGGECYPENQFDRTRKLAFLTCCALRLRTVDIERMRATPLMDPRQVFQTFHNRIWTNGGVIPLSGVRVPGQSVRESIRQSINGILEYTGLYPILQFLVSREWDPGYQMGTGRAPHFECRACGKKIYLPKSSRRFQCPACHHAHMLSDYLQLDQSDGDELVRTETAQALRNVLEVLTLCHFIQSMQDRPELLARTLFLRDGPLMLRANLYRLVDDIRAYIRHLAGRGERMHLVGIEKNGDTAAHIDVVKPALSRPGDFFLPGQRYITEEIHGRHFNPRIHRNRALFGAKVFVRVGPHHLLALNLPVCDFTNDSEPRDLLGFHNSISALAGLLSYQFENALIPIVLANRYASVSQRFSGGILDKFASSLLT